MALDLHLGTGRKTPTTLHAIHTVFARLVLTANIATIALRKAAVASFADESRGTT